MTFPIKKYPAFINRHVPAGDTDNLSVRLAGSPNLNRRPYIGEPPASGFPETPPGAAYPAGTTLIGFGEDVVSKAVNRLAYQLHSSVDSLADRPRYPAKLLAAILPGVGPLVTWPLYNADWGVGPGNDLLIYLGPPGTSAAEAWKYIQALDPNGLPVRAPDLSPVRVVNAVDNGGLTLYKMPLGAGYYPDGLCGKVLEFQVGVGTRLRLQEVDPAGPDTDLLTLAQYCLFNYSHFARKAQADLGGIWKAFAIVTNHAGGAGTFATVNHDLVADGWLVDDVVYLTTIAYAPGIMFDQACTYEAGTEIVSGGADRVSNGDGGGAAQAAVRSLGQPRDLTPTVLVRVPSTPAPILGQYAFDPWAAMFRADLETHGPYVQSGFVVRDVQDTAGADQKPGIAFAHFSVMHFTGPDTNISRVAADNAFQRVAGPTAVIELTTPGRFWVDSVTTNTDLIPGQGDFVEIYADAGGGVPGSLIGIWRLGQLDPAGLQATLISLGGSTDPTLIPATGFVRVVRPMLLQASTIQGVGASLRGGLRLIGANLPFTTYPLSLIDGPASHFLMCYHKEDDGQLTIVASVSSAGNIGTQGTVYAIGSVTSDAHVYAGTYVQAFAEVKAGSYVQAFSDFQYSASKTFYHIVSMASGESAGVSTWALAPLSAPHNYWFVDIAGVGTDLLVFPLNLPDGAEIQDLHVRFSQNLQALPGDAEKAYVALYKHPCVAADWTPGADRAFVDGVILDWPAGVTGGKILIDQLAADLNKFRVYVNGASYGETVNNELYDYWILVVPCTDGVDHDERLQGLRVTYRMTTLKPA